MTQIYRIVAQYDCAIAHDSLEHENRVLINSKSPIKSNWLLYIMLKKKKNELQGVEKKT